MQALVVTAITLACFKKADAPTDICHHVKVIRVHRPNPPSSSFVFLRWQS